MIAGMYYGMGSTDFIRITSILLFADLVSMRHNNIPSVYMSEK